jgi:acetyltransferase-like isoleucine patch superfamily enzyme
MPGDCSKRKSQAWLRHLLSIERRGMSRSSLSQSLGLGLSYLRVFSGLLWKFEAELKGADIGKSVRFEGRPIISVFPGSKLLIADRVSINSATRSNPVGCFQPSVVRTLAQNAELILERNSGISGAVLCAGRSIRIGEGTIIGSGAMIMDNDFHDLDELKGWQNEYQANARPILIGRNVFIGARAIILKGVTIGDKARVGAGAVVTQDVPSGQIAVGNPARLLNPT